LHAVETPESFESTGSFDVELENHGEAVHVHLHLDDALSEVASIEAINHHLRPGAVRYVPVAVHDDERSVTGRLKVAAAYGAETRYVDLSLQAVEPTKPPVEVDAALGEPGSAPRGGSTPHRSQDGSGSDSRSRAGFAEDGALSAGVLGDLDAPALALGVGVLFLAAIALVTIESATLLAGAFVLLAGILVAAGYVSLR
jgi:hypothetical protein